MYRRQALSLATATLATALFAGQASAQAPADIDAVKAANASFYAALSARDAKAMGALWADKPYVVNIGPRSKTVAVGYEEAVTKYWTNAFTNVFSEISATMTTTSQVQTDGKLAWVVGVEAATLKQKSDGTVVKFDNLATNVFEKVGDKWLMVSHHAANIAK